MNRAPSDPSFTAGADERRAPAGSHTRVRWLLRAALVMTGVLATVALLLVFVAYTAPGARLVFSQLDRLGIPVVADAVDGRLVGPLELRGLRVSSSNVELQIDTLDLDWEVGELLFQRRLHIQRLAATGVNLTMSSAEHTRASTSAESSPSELALPLDVVVDRARIEGLQASLPGGIRVERGRMTLTGTNRDYQLHGEGRVAARRLRHPADFRLDASGSLDSLEFERVIVDLPAGTLAASGAFAWYPAIRWSGRLDARDVDVSTFLPDSSLWPGRLELQGRTAGELDAGGLDAEVDIDTVSGSLRGRRLSGHASLGIDPRRIEVANLNFDWGSAHLEATGAIAESLDLDVDLDVPDLSLAIPQAAGALRVTGSVAGSKSSPVIQARFSGEAIRYGANRLAGLKGVADVGLAESDSVRLVLQAFDATIAGRALDSLAVDLQGTRRKHRLAASLESDGTKLDLTAHGGLAARDTTAAEDAPPGRFVWRGVLRRLQVVERRAGRWKMEDTSDSVVIAADEVVLRRELCLTSDESSLCLSGAWRAAAAWSARASIRDLPLALAEPFLPGGWSLGGKLDGTIQADAGEDGRLEVQARLQPGPGHIGYPVGAVGHEIDYERGSLDLVAGPAGLVASLAFALTGTDGDSIGHVRARVEMPGYQGRGMPSESQRLAGSAGLRLDDLEALEALAPQLQRLRGSLALRVDLDGTVGSPEILGEARLTNGAVDVPMLGLELRELDFSASGQPDGRIALEGGLRSGESRLKISGDSHLFPSPDAPSHLRMEGERVVAMNTERARVEASPKIDLEFDGDLLRIAGEVVVDTADMRLGEAERVVKVSPDVVYADSAESQAEISIDARVRVSLDGPVRVDGYGFAGQLSGSVLVSEQPDEPTRGSGELVIEEGKYSAFGQTLTIERGRLIFAGGPIDNPGLDIVATRSTEDVKAGMQVTGTAQTPLVTLFSEPPLPQDRIAVILATGGALESTGESDGNILESAKSKLGIKGANVLVRQIAAELDLEEARIESGGSLQEASLLAGKYLSPRLYVKYGLSLTDPLRMLQLRYMLSSKWTLVAETGEERGIDLLYRIETGI